MGLANFTYVPLSLDYRFRGGDDDITPSYHAPELPIGIDGFLVHLQNHPKLMHMDDKEWELLGKAFRFAEGVHYYDRRNGNKSPYITHPIEIIEDYIESYGEVSFETLVVLILHDAIEDHPECWKSVLGLFGLEIFRDVLVLTTGGIPLDIREDMIHVFNKYFVWKLPSKKSKNTEMLIVDIMHLLNPVEPLFKGQIDAGLAPGTPEFDKFEKAVLLYKYKILIERNKMATNEVYRSKEYIGLGNYLYMRIEDVRRKVGDMLHNMRDMSHMESQKPGYIQTRRIKAYILGVIMRNNTMESEYQRLEEAFRRAGSSMLSDDEVMDISRTIRGVVSSSSEG